MGDNALIYVKARKHARDNHPRGFSLWVAGAGIKRGHILGETDDFSCNIVKDPVHIHDLNATLMAQFGIDHTRLICRLTEIHGNIVKDMLV